VAKVIAGWSGQESGMPLDQVQTSAFNPRSQVLVTKTVIMRTQNKSLGKKMYFAFAWRLQ